MTYRIDRLGYLLHDASRLMRRRFAAHTVEHGLSATQWRLLGLLFREGPQTQAALADRLDVEPISVSRLIDRMEQSGWVRREPHPEDRRAHIILPTAQAEAIAPNLRGIAETVTEEALAALPDAAREVLHQALLTIIDTLNRPEPAEAGRGTDETRP
ncbi:MAG: MarR family transcriptional regulator [Gemmobacter sp.]|jgi:DNA-binding MarR family transcriptional regulator|nr:MarR family transcriptional regulator [Gemmobacter sp.]